MPTGVALHDPREQLFAAAERILLRDGPQALTSRAVTTEAGCAKGVLHRHFADFDDFLAALVRDRIAQLGPQAGCEQARSASHHAAQRKPLLAASLLTVYGVWQREGEVRHLIAKTLVDHSPMLQGLVTRSRDFH